MVETKRGANYPTAMKDSARRLFLEGMKPPSIAKELVQLYPNAERWPEPRTIQDWKKHWGIDQSGPWRMADRGDPEIVLPVLRALIVATKGKVTELTNAEAVEISRLGRSLKGMPALGMYNCARAMIAARAEDEPTLSLQHYLAFSPWADQGQGYTAAFDDGWISEKRAFCPDDEAWQREGTTSHRGGFGMGASIAPAEERRA